ncbi:MAG: alpha/beta hydrolase [Herminiimonas sp.]|nr:alpha/beta hydrolase [Herminiimonas sp.]
MLVKYITDKTEKDNPPAGRFIEVDGVQLHYLERGKGIPVVFLHGNGSMAQEFEISSLLGLAANKYRGIAFDRPGYGYSERPADKTWDPKAQADLLHKALQRLEVERPIIVGHSWGTMVAVSLAIEYPEYARSLVLLSGYFYPTPRLDALLLSPPAIPIVGDIMRHTLSPFIGRMIWPALIRKYFSPSAVTARWEAEFPVWMTLRPSQILASSAESAMMVPEALRLSGRYGELRLPVIIMAGANDIHVTTKIHSERLHRELPQSQLILVPDVGHMIHHVAPDQVLGAIDMAAETQSGLHSSGLPALYSRRSLL